MPYYDDMLIRLGINPDNPISHDVFNREDKLVIPSTEELARMFPSLLNASNPSIAYAPVVMCHSAPAFNKRKRGFTYNVLKNSVHTITDSLVNIEHNMKDNGISARGDHICGNMKAFYIPPPIFKESASDKKLSDIFGTDESVPVYSLLNLYMRHSMLKDILEEHVEKNNWFVSMECASDILQSCLFYNGEAIPIKEADKKLLDCIQRFTVNDYKNQSVHLLLGGIDGEVDFWGLGLTKKPADEGSNILNLFCANQCSKKLNKSEVAYMPLKTYIISRKNNFVNDPEKIFDNLVHEAASIIPIGETEPSEDGHKHDILTDGTIMPVAGHTHYLSRWELSPGTNPIFTGIVSDYETYIKQMDGETSREIRISHNHLININLRKKVKGQKEEETLVTDVAHSPLEEHMPKFLDTLKDGLSKLKTKVEGDGKVTVEQILSDLASIDITKEIADEVDTVIAGKIDGGELVKSDAVQAKVDEAVKAKEKELNDAAEAERKKQEVISLRLKQLTDANVDVETKIGKEGNQKTIKEIVSAMDVNDDTQFNMQLDVFIKAFAKKIAEGEKVPEAASTGRKAIVVGGGIVTSTDADGKEIKKKIIGKNAITSV